MIFEYGYLAPGSHVERVVFCRFKEAEIPSDVADEGHRGRDVDFEAAELPRAMERGHLMAG